MAGVPHAQPLPVFLNRAGSRPGQAVTRHQPPVTSHHTRSGALNLNGCNCSRCPGIKIRLRQHLSWSSSALQGSAWTLKLAMVKYYANCELLRSRLFFSRKRHKAKGRHSWHSRSRVRGSMAGFSKTIIVRFIPSILPTINREAMASE